LRRRYAHICIITALALLAASCLATLTGCGSDESKARQYVEAAREKSKQVALSEEQLRQRGDQMTKFFDTIQNITPETAEAMKNFFTQLVKDVEAINKAAQATRQEYERILELNGVTDFKKYANNRIKALELINRRSQLVKQFAAIYSTVIDSALNGQEINEDLIRNQTQPIIDERNQTSQEIEGLNQQAADLAQKLKLE
jgi:predicted small secreted protein